MWPYRITDKAIEEKVNGIGEKWGIVLNLR
jgi:hypothetical protein